MARGAVSAARMTISEMPLLRVLVAAGVFVSLGLERVWEVGGVYLRWRLSLAGGSGRLVGRGRGSLARGLGRRRARRRIGRSFCLRCLARAVVGMSF